VYEIRIDSYKTTLVVLSLTIVYLGKSQAGFGRVFGLSPGLTRAYAVNVVVERNVYCWCPGII
jgi:hypothetical protein